MSRGANLLHAIFSSYWAMREDKLHAMVAFLDERLEGARFSAEDIRARVGDGRSARTAATPTGVAVLPLFGVISHRAHLVQDISGPGGTSTELFGQDFDAAMADPKVGTIVLDIDSPGGNVAGVQELADKIYGARGDKKIIAVANSLAASAAYWIGSAADELVVTPSGEVGSIGVFAIHSDTSRRDANVGVTRTVLKAGKHKAEGMPFEPLGSDARDYAQQQIDEFYGQFIDAVARQRGVSTEVARGEKFGEGRTVTARQAVARKMADRVATLEQVLGELGVQPTGGQSMRGGRRADDVDDDSYTVTIDLPVAGAEGAGGVATTIGEHVSLIERAAAAALGSVSFGVNATCTAPYLLLPPARQGVDAELPEPLASSAEQAKEHPVPPTTTTAPGTPGAVDDSATLRAELDRQTRIRELCELVGASATDQNSFISSGATPEQVRQTLQAKRGTPTPAAPVTVGADRDADRPFASIGEQLVAIVQAGKPGGRFDRRLSAVNAAASGMNENVGSEGGYFLQPDLLPGVMEPVYQQDPFLQRVKRIPIGAGKNSVKYNVIDETSRANGSRYGGIQAYWAAEADTASGKKPKLRQVMLDLKKIIGIGYLTDELMEDAPASQALLVSAFQNETRFMVGDAGFRGTGAGQPLGFLNSAALLTQAIEGTQTIANSDQFIAKNTAKMLSQLPAEFWNEAIWLFQPELLPYLVTATIGTSAVPLYIQGGGMQDAPPATIWGRPAFASDFCEAVGTPGDIVLVAPSQYHLGVRDETATVAGSVHVRFLNDEQTLRITHRVDGTPLWVSKVTPYKGSSRSPYIVLNTRV